MLIVEDEAFERECLLNYYNWSDFGISTVETAYDGIDGFEKAEEVQPDIIITDVKMPGMDGLEMSKKIKQFLPDVKIIVLTGCEDFKLVKEAIRLNAYGYLLKPFEDKEFVETINKVVETCKQERGILGRILDLETKIEEGAKAAWLMKVNAMYSGRIKSEEVHAIAEEIGLSSTHGRFSAAAIKLPGSYEMRAVEFLTAPAGKALFVQDKAEPNQFLMCLSEMPASDELAASIGDIIESVLIIEGDCSKYIGIGMPVDELHKIHLSCKQAKQALEFAEFWDIAGLPVSYEQAVAKTEEFKSVICEFLTNGNYYTRQILHGVRAADTDRVKNLLEEMFAYIEDSIGAGRELISTYLFNAFNETLLQLFTMSRSIKPVNLQDLDVWNKVLGMTNLRDMRSITYRFYDHVMYILQDKKGNGDEHIVKKVLALIQEKPTFEVSLKSIAGELFLSPNHLGKIFRNRIGKSFNEYLNDFRMEKARTLLQSPKNNVKFVSQEVGLSKASYFCALFKATYGVTPGEYQETLFK